MTKDKGEITAARDIMRAIFYSGQIDDIPAMDNRLKQALKDLEDMVAGVPNGVNAALMVQDCDLDFMHVFGRSHADICKEATEILNNGLRGWDE